MITKIENVKDLFPYWKKGKWNHERFFFALYFTFGELANPTDEVAIENVQEYIYFGHTIKMGKENQTVEINRAEVGVGRTCSQTGPKAVD